MLVICLAFLFVPAHFTGAAKKDTEINAADSEKFVKAAEEKFPTSSQVILVTQGRVSGAEARLSAFEMKEDTWNSILGPVPAMIGRNGFAPAGEKHEGDGRTPPGIYTLGFAFGYGPQIDSAMPYLQMTLDDIWVDDPASPDYNRLKKRAQTCAGSFEDMVLPDGRYKYGIVIEYNTEPVIPNCGSAIFLHVWKDPGIPTSGCVAISKEDILKLLKWLDPEKQPIIMLGVP